jgi:DHA1 family tetracycline resistance protein-like MFS transporter
MIRRLGEPRAALFGMCVNVTTLTALGLLTSAPLVLALIPLTALGGVTTPALQSLLSRATPENAQGELQGLLSSLTAIASIVSPLMMTATFSAFTAPGAPFHLPGAPFLLAAALMLVCVALHVASPRAARHPSPLA